MPLKIEFEGTDGAGKTTGLRYFIEMAQKANLNVVETREVGNPHLSTCTKLREIVLSPDSGLSGESMELIFSAMRLENDRWFKALPESVDLVVSDRGWLSHLAYTDHNVSEEFTQRLYNDLVEDLSALPDVVIYFKVSPEKALQRRIRRGEAMDVIESKGIEFQDKVRLSFLKHIEKYSSDIEIYAVDADQDLESVQEQLKVIFSQIKDR